MQQRDQELSSAPRPRVVSGDGETPIAEDRRRDTTEASVLRVPSAEVYHLDDYRDFGFASAAPPPITSLYRDRAHSSPHLARALDLLEDGHRALNRALQSCSEGDAIAVDDAVQELQATLPELFLCGDLGEGYGAVVAGLHFAFENRGGEPLEERQIRAVKYVINELHTAPFMPITTAHQLLARLEQNGLIVTPVMLSSLFDEDLTE